MYKALLSVHYVLAYRKMKRADKTKALSGNLSTVGCFSQFHSYQRSRAAMLELIKKWEITIQKQFELQLEKTNFCQTLG